ncbi:MAG: glycerol acyltransferase [Bacteroidetes bacterium]|nr:glycerol acyltransferase [Bacteroidota bacterium]
MTFLMLKKIDIDEVFRGKNAALYKLLPGFIFSYLKRIIHQNEINRFIEHHGSKYDFDFVKAILDEFGIQTKVIGAENIPPSGGCIFSANHPLGALDAMAMLDEMGEVRRDVRFLVNDMLMNLDNLKNIFAGVNKVGKTSAEALQEVENVYSQNIAVATFPAGLVSRKQFLNGHFGKYVINDLEWKKSFISRAKKYQKNIIPVFIDGKNSNFFYNLALWRKRLGIKMNIEMLYLVDELHKQQNNTITVIFGKEIPFETFDKRMSDSEWAEKVKEHVYRMGKEKLSLKFETSS